MIYDSLDIIPVKLFFKILDNENHMLLSTDSIKNSKKLEAIWVELKEKHEELDPDSIEKETKFFKLYKKLEELNARYKFIHTALSYLKYFEDTDLQNVLIEKGFSFSGDSEKDLKDIARHLNAIEVKLGRIKNQLPKKNENDKPRKETSLDEAILGFAAITELGFVDTNKITVTQFYAIKEIASQKIKSLEKQADGKKR